MKLLKQVIIALSLTVLLSNVNGQSADYSYAAIISILHKGDYQKAIEEINFLVSKNNENSTGLLFLRSTIYVELNQLDNALNDICKVISVSEFSDYYLERGYIHRLQNKYREALEDYNTAIKLNKGNQLAYTRRAFLNNTLGNYQL